MLIPITQQTFRTRYCCGHLYGARAIHDIGGEEEAHGRLGYQLSDAADTAAATGALIPVDPSALRSRFGKVELSIDCAVPRLIVIAFVSANCSPGLRPQDSIDWTMIVPGASEPALRRHDIGSIAVTISVTGSPVTVPIVAVGIRVVSVRIGIRIIPIEREWREERETKRVDKDDRSIVEVMKPIMSTKIPTVEMVETGWRG